MQSQSVLAASVRELSQAYRVSLQENDPDAEVFRLALIERLVMVCDCIADSSGVGGAYRHESQRGGGAL
jgi:hypothetical protein